MGRINRRIYATRRKRSSAFKTFAPAYTGPRREYSADELATQKSRRESDLIDFMSNDNMYRPQQGGGGSDRERIFTQQSQVWESHPRPKSQPPYLKGRGKKGEEGVESGTYTITKA